MGPVAAELNNLEQQIEQLTRTLERQVELLTEHRQALITATVTSQLPVPGVAA